MRPIRVLSLFDGMSCGQIALRDLGIPIEVYYASEIDKFAIQQTQLNFPDTVQLGDVRNIDVDKLCEMGVCISHKSYLEFHEYRIEGYEDYLHRRDAERLFHQDIAIQAP